jgi:altronate dehydratase
LRIREALPLGHKIALRDLPAGHHVRKYGEVIGALQQPVTAGEHVHVHNLKSLRA